MDNKVTELFKKFIPTDDTSIEAQAKAFDDTTSLNTTIQLAQYGHLNDLYGVELGVFYPGMSIREEIFILALLFKGTLPTRNDDGSLNWPGYESEIAAAKALLETLNV